MRITHIVLAALLTVQALACGAAAAPLSDAEKAELALVREEEKLARDVYTEVSAVGGTTFENVTDSEQTHMDRVKVLLDTYGVADPAAGKAPGEFTHAEYGALYSALVARGKVTRAAALAVGCEIEELDIHDLTGVRERSSQADVKAALDDLLRGSRNHLRAFYGQLRADGGSYAPKHVDQATFDAVVNSAQEKGNGR